MDADGRDRGIMPAYRNTTPSGESFSLRRGLAGRLALGVVLSVFLITATGAAGHAAMSTNESGNRVVVLSYNIRHGEGIDGRIDLARIALVIKSVSPDLVSLQEVDARTKRSNGVDQAKELARLTGMRAVFGPSMYFEGGKYGNAVLTKLTVKKASIIRLPGEPRSALCVMVEMPGAKGEMASFAMIATHLDVEAKPRNESPPLISKLLAFNMNAPAILAGDMNDVPESPTILALGRIWGNATSRKGLFTFPSDDPVRQIDYVMCRPSNRWKVVGSRVLNVTVASDHRPIMAVLEWLPVPGAN